MAKLFSMVVPVFQNAANLEDTVSALLSLQQRLPEYELELVFVDDGSSDGSLSILSELASANPGILRILKLSRNFGQTPAIQAGLRFAQGDCVGIISADLQEPHEAFVDMIHAWEQGAKFVMGERELRQEGRFHQLVSNAYWWLIRRFAFPDFPRLGYDFCLLDRQVVDDINKINEKNSMIFVLIYWLGYRPVRIPIMRRKRDKGRSQWRFWAKVGFTLDTLIGFTYLPARVISILGFATGTLCVAYLILMLVNWFLHRAAPPGWMTVVGILTLVGAMVLFALGIVSEYLLRILDEARKRPPYVVEQVIAQREKAESNRKS